MSDNWKTNIEIDALSFDGLKCITKQLADQFAAAKSFKDVSKSYYSGFGSYRLSLEGQMHNRITQLRKEADELEDAQR
jgi:hypothetical protein